MLKSSFFKEISWRKTSVYLLFVEAINDLKKVRHPDYCTTTTNLSKFFFHCVFASVNEIAIPQSSHVS